MMKLSVVVVVVVCAVAIDAASYSHMFVPPGDQGTGGGSSCGDKPVNVPYSDPGKCNSCLCDNNGVTSCDTCEVVAVPTQANCYRKTSDAYPQCCEWLCPGNPRYTQADYDKFKGQ